MNRDWNLITVNNMQKDNIMIRTYNNNLKMIYLIIIKVQ